MLIGWEILARFGRLLLTVPMHGATSLVFYAGGKEVLDRLGLAVA